MTLGNRIQILRKEKKLTQSKLAEYINISTPQIVRYETKGVQPPADVLKRLADVFGTSIDYIVNGKLEQKAKRSIGDNELLQQFKEVEQMNEDDRSTVKKLIDAFITKRKVQKLAQ